MTAQKQIDPSDPPPLTIESPPEMMLAAINTLKQQRATAQADAIAKDVANAALREDIRRRDAAEVTDWAPIKVAASLTDTPYATVHRWLSAGHLKSRKEKGRMEILLESVFAHIRRLGRDRK